MYEKEDLSQEEIKERAEQLGLKQSEKDENIFVLEVGNKSENDLQNLSVELERRGFKKVEAEDENSQLIDYTYDASLAAPRG